jgi:hypothetical protein
VYGGSSWEDLPAIASKFSGIYLANETLSDAKLVTSILKAWPQDKPIIVQAAGHQYVSAAVAIGWVCASLMVVSVSSCIQACVCAADELTAQASTPLRRH